MANPNSPFGFRPISRMGGAPFSVSQYAKPSSDTNALFMGDLVIKAAAGVTDPFGSAINITGIQTGYQGTPGTSLWQGVALNYGAASTLTAHAVVDQPDAIFLCQGKTGTTYSTASHAGKNANMSTTTAGSTTTRQSGMTVDGATIATTSSLDLRLLAISRLASNAEGANAIFEVVINKHGLGQQTAGV